MRGRESNGKILFSFSSCLSLTPPLPLSRDAAKAAEKMKNLGANFFFANVPDFFFRCSTEYFLSADFSPFVSGFASSPFFSGSKYQPDFTLVTKIPERGQLQSPAGSGGCSGSAGSSGCIISHRQIFDRYKLPIGLTDLTLLDKMPSLIYLSNDPSRKFCNEK